jgi:hypothetical protein
MKEKVKLVVCNVMAERNADFRVMEHYYYMRIYDILNSNAEHEEKPHQLKRYKALLIRLTVLRTDGIMLDVQGDRMRGEQTKLFQILKQHQRRKQGAIMAICNPQGVVCTSTTDVRTVFRDHLRDKYAQLEVDRVSIDQLQRFITRNSTVSYSWLLDQPITEEEIVRALKKCGKNKAPGDDGMCIEFYTENWETIKQDLLELLNQMFMQQRISTKQKHGIIVCLPKNDQASTPDEYRPISLLTKDYKLFARIMASRLSTILQYTLHRTQFCGVPENTILDALTIVRDAIAISESTGAPLCVISLDFTNAFDKISHQYLFQILHHYGITPWFIERIRTLYSNAHFIRPD